jgi:hypothetical protein
MPHWITLISGITLAAGIAFAPSSAWAAPDGGVPPKDSAAKVGTAAAASKATKCAQLKKKIADYKAAEAAAKGAKVSGSETIKSDIVWVQANCN